MKLEEAKKHFGGTRQLADALNVWPQAIYKWKKNGIPKWHQFAIEVKSGGVLKADKEPHRG